jgi:tetratricopeptide (TPR) repeat protein
MKRFKGGLSGACVAAALLLECPTVNADDDCGSAIDAFSQEGELLAQIDEQDAFRLLYAQGQLAYAGAQPNPRPLPKVFLLDHARNLSAFSEHRGGMESAIQVAANGLFYAIFNEKPGSREPEAINAPAQVMWCLLRPGTYLLLNDGNTAHYTIVGKVDRESGLVYLVDLWPDTIFLLKDRNFEDIDARLIGRDGKELTVQEAQSSEAASVLVRITRAELLRVLVGAIRRDTPEFEERFYSLHPDARRDLKTRTAFGLLFLNGPGGRFNEAAVPALQSALDLAKSLNATSEARFLAGRLYLSSWIQVGAAIDDTTATEAQRRAEYLAAKFGERELVDGYVAADLFRLGNAFMGPRRSDWKHAAAAFGLAIEKDPDYSEAYVRRADAEFELGHPSNVINDTSRALNLIVPKMAALLQDKEQRRPDDIVGLYSDQWAIEALRDDLVHAMEWRSQSFLKLADYQGALDDANELMKIAPDKWLAYAVCGRAQLGLNNVPASIECFEAARQHTNDPAVISQLDDFLSKLK